MLNKLFFDVTFSTGRRITQSHEFQSGLTGIAGDNEAGKSLNFEYIRYALFGTDALRGTQDTYKSLSVELIFTLDKTYRVTRNLSTSAFYDGEDKVAAGHSTVNKKILALIGYDLKVFDMANACLQGQIKALGKMKPTERIKCVDKVIGMDALDKVIVQVAAEALTEDKVLERLVQMAKPPVRPEAHPDYVGSKFIEKAMTRDRALADERISLLAEMKAITCSAPGPAPVENTDDLAELSQKQAEFDLAFKKVEQAESKIPREHPLKGPPDIDVAALQVYLETSIPEDFEARQRWETGAANYPKPEQSNAIWKAVEASIEMDAIALRVQKLRADTSVTCPHCAKDFSLQQDKIDQLEKPLEELKKIVAGLELEEVAICESYIQKGYTAKQCNQQVAKNNAYDVFHHQNPEPPVVDVSVYQGKRSVIKAQLEEYRKYKEYLDNFNRTTAELKAAQDDFATKENVEARIKARIRYDIDMNCYNEAKKKYDAFVKRQSEIEPRLAELDGIQNIVLIQEAELKKSRAFESLYTSYLIQLGVYEDQMLAIDEQKFKVDQLRNLKQALVTLKPKVKSYLMPSLNLVASNLLSQMTNGERNRIDISEDFDILVDGQAVETLSGSGEDIANLAIRIALGSVLTNKVLSVFLGDEVDAAMRGERAAYTAQCFRNLTKIVKQIIVISHKELEVDRLIQV